jgi:hypothetical protein
MHHHHGQTIWDRQPDQVEGIGASHQNKAAADARRDVVGMGRAGAQPLALERAGHQGIN